MNEAKGLQLTIGSSLTIETTRELFGAVKINFGDDEDNFSSPSSVDSIHPSLNHPEFSTRDWIVYFMGRLECSQITLLFRAGCSRFNINSILKTFEGLSILELFLQEELGEQGPKILECFPPTKQLSLLKVPNMDREVLRKILNRKYYFLYLGDSKFPWTLLDFMGMQSEHVEFFFSAFPSDQLNTLLKVWIDGWNSKVVSMACRITKGIIPENILDGIDYEVVPDGEERPDTPRKCGSVVFYMCNNEAKRYDIQRQDGKKATVYITLGLTKVFKFLVHH